MTALLLSAVLLSVGDCRPCREHQHDRVLAAARAGYDPRPAIVAPYRAKLERMARCESTGRWFIATGNGFFGGLQFDLRTWWSVGGRGYPHQASKLEQMFRAVRLIKRRGYAPWPVCGFA